MASNPTQVFKRDATWRKHVLRNLVTDLIIHGKVQTTEARAKEVKRHIDKLITKGKKNTLAARRNAEKILRPVKTKDGIAVGKHLFEVLAPKYKDRKGGYTRLIKSPSRKGDNTKMAIIELI